MSKVKKQGPLGLKQRWSVRRKQEVVLPNISGTIFPGGFKVEVQRWPLGSSRLVFGSRVVFEVYC